MPDQSSAASEHAIIQEITAPLSTMPDDPVSVPPIAHFPVAIRGYDRIAVDAYVKQTSQLVAELQATRSPEAAIKRALERVGEQISGILQRAHDTAEQITSQSRSEGEDRLEAARAGGRADHRRGGAAAQGSRRRHRPDLGRAPADRRGHPRARGPAARAHRLRGRAVPGGRDLRGAGARRQARAGGAARVLRARRRGGARTRLIPVRRSPGQTRTASTRPARTTRTSPTTSRATPTPRSRTQTTRRPS